ncbi:MAG: NUDIX hydrolase [Leptolyngbya sp. SIOISBB]|nr:NUDIX hydrolase [Leptolyngbya sp. SIOISBB]
MMGAWAVRDRFLNLETRWFNLIGEHLETEQGNLLEYWRVERAHSLIVLALLDNTLLLPEPMYRPGVGAATLDFPGGRVSPEQSLDTAARQILHRELGIDVEPSLPLLLLNPGGWPVNSSFSNQRLFGMVAHLTSSCSPTVPHRRYACSPAGIEQLLTQLSCLQCRAVVREWQVHNDDMP